MKTAVGRVLGTAVTLALLASPAAAHVSVNPTEARKGAVAELTFRVPNERDDASTIKVEITFDADHPIENVSVRSTPGWSNAVQRNQSSQSSGGATTASTAATITWSGGRIAPGESEEFRVSLGPLPDADRLVFKAIQTYDNGEIVRWIDVPSGGDDKPEHPAPILTLIGADAETAAQPATTAAEPAEPTADHAATSGNEDGDEDHDDHLGWAGVITGGLALVFSLIALLRSGREPRRERSAP